MGTQIERIEQTFDGFFTIAQKKSVLNPPDLFNPRSHPLASLRAYPKARQTSPL